MRYLVKLTLDVEADSRGDAIDAVVREVKVARVQVSIAGDATFEITEGTPEMDNE